MKWFVLFFAILVGITTTELIGWSPEHWQYWVNVLTITVVGSAQAFFEEWL